jgi:mannose-1-phosphate guanylyltransferase
MPGFKVPVLLFESATRRIIAVNDVAAALFRSAAADMLGKSVDSCVIPEERARLAAIVGTREPRWGDVGSWQCVARDGSRFIAQVRFHQTFQDGLLVHVVLATNVSHLETVRSAAAGFDDSMPRCG